MCEQARKVFNIKEQRAKDFLTAIKTISAVIPLIREWGKVEKEWKEINAKKGKISNEIKTLKNALEILSDNHVIKVISEEYEEKTKVYNELCKKYDELLEFYVSFENEVELYKKYAEDFAGLVSDEILAELVLPKLKNQNECLAILFWSYNVKSVVHEPIKSFLAQKNFDTSIYRLGLKNMIEELKANEL